VEKDVTSVNKIKVLVVDDSAFARVTISKHINMDPGIEVIGSAVNGLDAIDKIKGLKPDVITLDVTMPKMDGIEALEHIMNNCPVPVIMLSNLTGPGTETTVKALELGAVDFFLKPSLINPVGDNDLVGDLMSKIKIASKINIAMLKSHPVEPQRPAVTQTPANKVVDFNGPEPVNIVVIGSSTGGPKALYDFIPYLPGNLNAAILMVQHMPPKFTRSLADRLNQLSQITIKEAEVDDGIYTGRALLAPGGFHMIVNQSKKVELSLDKPRNGLRPAVDVTMQSAVQIYGAKCVGVIMTGMGNDGTLGCAMIKASGGRVIAQDESTSVVYGMPKCVVEAGLADKVVPLPELAETLSAICNKSKKTMVSV
jgi:two-component system, chemotaxis family, protein-glutamate methylesterase/glutaminase